MVVKRPPVVSVICISFNQEKYITQALDGFVMQKTDFVFEVIIADDSSSDDTPRIIDEYARKYPDIIKPILRKKNLGPQANFVDALKKGSGNYIAICEGDDFWTDPFKLQKQVDFLDSHKSSSLVFHPVRVFFENHEQEDTIFPKTTDARMFTVSNLLKNNFIQTNSVMYRRISYDAISLDVMPFDWYLHLFHAKGGKIGFINEVMSAYRRHVGGIWWETTHKGEDEIWKRYGVAHMALYSEMLKMYDDKPENRQIIDEHVQGTVNILNRIDHSEGTNLISEFVERLPGLIAPLLLSLSRVTYENYEQLKKHEKELQVARDTINDLQLEKEQIITSKTYKVATKLAKASHIARGIK